MLVLMLACLVIAGSAEGQEASESESAKSRVQFDDLGERAGSPLGFLPGVAFKNTMDFGAPNGSAYLLSLFMDLFVPYKPILRS
jgi:hypothetical protein